MDRIGKPVVLNICMLGAVIGLTQIVKTDSIVKVLESKIPSGFLEMNKKPGLGTPAGRGVQLQTRVTLMKVFFTKIFFRSTPWIRPLNPDGWRR